MYMYKFKTIFLMLAGLFILNSCYNLGSDEPEQLSLDKDFEVVKVNNEYVVKIPKYLDKTTDLNDEATLQYQNIFREAYIIILDESKSDMEEAAKSIGEFDDNQSLLKNYKNLQLKYSLAGLDILQQYNEKSLKINGINAEKVDIDAYSEEIDIKITYFLTFYEGPEKVYMMMAWTLENRKQKYKPTFDQTASSFKLYN